MEQGECFPLNSKFARKSVLVKTKPFNRQTVISINQLFKVLSTGMNTCPQSWAPLISGLVDDTLLELSSAFKFLQGSVATLFRWSWKILSYFVANLSNTLHINLYQNRSNIVQVMTQTFWCFLCLTVYNKYNLIHCPICTEWQTTQPDKLDRVEKNHDLKKIEKIRFF